MVHANRTTSWSRLLANLQLGEFIYEQPASGDIEYIFKHALTQEVAYNSMLIERRQLLHERAAQALEALYRRATRATIWRNWRIITAAAAILRKAVEYLARGGPAGAAALRHSRGARLICSMALELLEKLPESRRARSARTRPASGTCVWCC